MNPDGTDVSISGFGISLIKQVRYKSFTITSLFTSRTVN